MGIKQPRSARSINSTLLSPKSIRSDFGTVLNKVAVYECPTSGKRIIMSNGIPDHEITQGNPNSPCETNWFVSMPLNPVKTTTAMEPAALGIVAMSLNGVPAYGAQEGGGTNAAEPAAGAQITDAQYWYGHAAMQGDHHYHNPNLGHSTMPSESTLMGYALDGFPIYGAVADDSVLDQCNGQTVQGSYQYHVSFRAKQDSNRKNSKLTEASFARAPRRAPPRARETGEDA